MAAVPANAAVTPRAGVDRALRRGIVVSVVAVLGILVYGTVAAQRSAPPIPATVVTVDGRVLFTKHDIQQGKKLFQRAGLMDFGSLYGNGAYFGPDWGTDYLHRQDVFLQNARAQAIAGVPYASLTEPWKSLADGLVRDEQKQNRYQGGRLVFTPRQAAAHASIQAYYRQLFLHGDKQLGLQANVVRNVHEADQLTAFLGWVAWTESAKRPGTGHSYTNNWPYDPASGNKATSAMWWWTWGSLIAMVALAVITIQLYRRFIAPPAGSLAAPAAVEPLPVTPSQRGTVKWFLLVPPLLLAQATVGILIAHAFAERTGFFGIDLRGWLPYAVLHSWHLQLAIAWVAAAWLGFGLYLAPIVGGKEPRFQKHLSTILWAAVVLVVVGGLVGIWLGIRGKVDSAWFWVGNQGLEFIELGRLWQLALFAGLLLWAAVLLRAFLPGLRARRDWGGLESLLLYSGAAIGIVYGFGLLSEPLTGATMTDYWRWWVVHLWVENIFEFFTVAVTGYAVLAMGLLSRRFVERIVYFELILIFGSGFVGMGHHFYWVGEPAVWLALGAMFSMVEVVPLGVLVVRAWHEYRAVRAAGHEFPQRTAFMFFTSAAVWNVAGAGLLGALINPPIVNYYEHGEFLTLAHGHAAMFGSFGLLALGLMYMGVRGVARPERVKEARSLLALRCFNLGLVLWLALNLLPVGIWQLAATVDHGYWFARSLEFYNDTTVFQWLRLPGDVAFAIGGLLVLVDLLAILPFRREPSAGEEEPLVLPPALLAD
jgi:nitric oxide reductase subunit B